LVVKVDPGYVFLFILLTHWHSSSICYHPRFVKNVRQKPERKL
jgi:hypothetical protein